MSGAKRTIKFTSMHLTRNQERNTYIGQMFALDQSKQHSREKKHVFSVNRGKINIKHTNTASLNFTI